MDIPPSKIIPVVKTLYEKEENEFNKNRYAQVLGIFLLRNREYAAAQTYFKDLDLNFWAVAYSAVTVKSPTNRVVQIRVSSDESCKLWFNDDLVWQTFRLKEDTPLDNDIVSVVLQRGYNKILIKTTNSLYNWGFNLRVTDEKGKGFPDLEFFPPKEVEEKLVSK